MDDATLKAMLNELTIAHTIGLVIMIAGLLAREGKMTDDDMIELIKFDTEEKYR